jgi:tetratricopeptide (TPR) repeat protein
MNRLLGILVVGGLMSTYCLSQDNAAATDTTVRSEAKPSNTQQQKESYQQRESGTPSAPASVKLNTPTLNMDVLLDLYNKDIDFTIDYSGQALKQPRQGTAGEGEEGKPQTAKQKKRAAEVTEDLLKPREEDLSTDIQDIVDTSRIKKKQAKQGTYTKEDADYNKALFNLQEAQKLFSERRYPQALAEINKSVDSAPNMALAYAVRGSIYYMLRQFQEAKSSWEKALELDPSMDNVRAILYRM